jgi:hypothetical protein
VAYPVAAYPATLTLQLGYPATRLPCNAYPATLTLQRLPCSSLPCSSLPCNSVAYPATLTLQRLPCNAYPVAYPATARFHQVRSAGDIRGCGLAGGEQPLIFSHTKHLSEILFAAANHCAQFSLSTRVDGYMRGTGQSDLSAM